VDGTKLIDKFNGKIRTHSSESILKVLACTWTIIAEHVCSYQLITLFRFVLARSKQQTFT